MKRISVSLILGIFIVFLLVSSSYAFKVSPAIIDDIKLDRGKSGVANLSFIGSKRQEKINEYSEKFANPYVAASRGLIDDVIDPRQTRISVINALESCSTKRENRFSKKHGNIPL